jgi:hypothetical protein
MLHALISSAVLHPLDFIGCANLSHGPRTAIMSYGGYYEYERQLAGGASARSRSRPAARSAGKPARDSSLALLLYRRDTWASGVELTPSPLDLFRQGSLPGQRGSVFCSEHFIGKAFERVLRYCVIPFGAKYQADRRVLTGEGPMLTCIIQI